MRIYNESNKISNSETKKASISLIVVGAILMGLMLQGCGVGNVGYPIPGPQGPAGKDGAPGTQITVVQLCPGITTYPSTFVEVAFCVNDKLYAVYSANGGFETEIVPGYYDSKGIGSSCSFYVETHCLVHS